MNFLFVKLYKDNILLNNERDFSSIKICDFGLSLANDPSEGINSS